ncbi:hypothetical protein, partial [Nostoc foliaceum]
VDVVENNSAVFNNPVIAASEPHKEALVREWRQRYPIPVDADYGSAKVLRTGKSELATNILESSLQLNLWLLTMRLPLPQLNLLLNT